jgi:carboxyl-terminal processing protease
LLAEAYATVQHQYVDRTAVQPQELTYGAISGMVDSLGDTGHTTFLTPEMVKELKNMERGEFRGIGVEIQLKDDRVVVVAPVDGSPAQKAGLRAGDIIAKVFGQDVTGWPLNRVVEKITGPLGTKVRLTVQNPQTGREREVTLVRADIKVHDVTWQRLPGTEVAHVRLAAFDTGVTRDLKLALTEIQKQKLQGVILDLRNNPGGILDEAIGVASQFLADGNVLIAKDAKGNTAPLSVEKGGVATNIPVVVLVNVGSASASEIVAGALQDAHRASLVGETTFGTGTVLAQFRLSDGSALLLAIQEWLTPKGRSFWHKGLAPDIKVELNNDIAPLLPGAEREMTAQQLRASSDKQLLRALEVVQSEKEEAVTHASR